MSKKLQFQLLKNSFIITVINLVPYMIYVFQKNVSLHEIPTSNIRITLLFTIVSIVCATLAAINMNQSQKTENIEEKKDKSLKVAYLTILQTLTTLVGPLYLLIPLWLR